MINRLIAAAKKISTWSVPLAAALMIAAFLYIAPPGILGKADALGYAVCHRLAERSFHAGDYQLPLCARCSGMYLGAVVGVAFLSLTYRRSGGTPPKWVIAVLVLFGVAFAIDGSNSYLFLLKSVTPNSFFAKIPNIYTPNNVLRLLTGSGTGLAIAVAVFYSFNQTIWRNWNRRSVLEKPRDFGLLLALMLTIDLLMLPEWPVILYPAALISAGGVLLLLTMVYSMFWMMLMRDDNTFTTLTSAWLPILAGLTIALIQITVIDVFRLWLTQTWGGFPL